MLYREVMDTGLLSSALLTRGKHKEIIHQEAHANKEQDVEQPCVEDVQRLQQCAGNACRKIAEEPDCLHARAQGHAELMCAVRSEALSKRICNPAPGMTVPCHP